ncbi:MAG: lysogenization regulator HflD, partial [Chlorobi bacterium]|nr:lysogenization regulator HflD [Chlorobiota bacterium]
MRFIRFHILFIIIAFSFNGFSSDSVFESNESSAVTIGFNTLATDGNSVNNYFIKEIARNNLSGLYKTAFTFNYSYSSSIEKSEDGVFKVITTLRGEKCTGDVYYKGFDLSDILMPDMADLRIVVSANGGFFVSSGFEGIKFNEQNVAEFDFTFDYPEGDNAYSIRFENISFYSRDGDKKEFNRRINLIDNYIASITFLKQAVDRFDSIDVQNTDNVLDTYVELNELSRVFQRISECEFVDELHIRDNDPKRYFETLAKFERKLTSYRSVYNQLLNSLHGIQLHENLADCATKYVDLIGHELEMSQEVTHSYSTLFYQMGRIEYENSDVTDFLLGMDDIYSKADMD